MTPQYIKSKIEDKAKVTNNTSCLIYYCMKAFSRYFTEDEIFEIINNITKQRSRNTYKSFFTLGN